MNKSYRVRCPRHLAALTFLAVLAAALLRVNTASAWMAGIDSSRFTPVLTNGCNNCHNSPGVAVAPGVQLMASTMSPTAGQQITLTFVVTSMGVTQTHAGFNIRSSQLGTFAASGAGTRTILNAMTSASEATHTAPMANVANVSTFIVLWTPNAGIGGAVTFTAWGNSVNLSMNNSGDMAAMTTLAVTYPPGCTPTTWYADADADGYGNPAVTTSACTQPAGYVANNTDCNDSASGGAAIHPGATEVCNGIDDDCDLTADNGLAMMTFYLDADADGYGATTKMACSLAAAGANYIATGGDCDDTRPLVHPGAIEMCNGMDDDCNTLTDDGLGTITCGVSPCEVMLPACAGGMVQQCPPGAGICPVDAGPDTASSPDEDAGAAVDAATNIDTGISVDAGRQNDATGGDARARPDATARDAGSQPGADAVAADAPVGTGPETDAARGVDDVGSVTPVDAQAGVDSPLDAPGVAPPAADADSTDGGPTDNGCSCRLASRSIGGAEALFGAALLALSWARRRRRGPAPGR